MNLRRAWDRDMPGVLHIYNTVHPNPDPHREWGPLKVIGAFYEGAVVGYTSALNAGRGVLILTETLVLPEYQGMGLGRRLMDARFDLGRALGLTVAACAHAPGHDHPAMRKMMKDYGFMVAPDHVAPELLRPNALIYWMDLNGI